MSEILGGNKPIYEDNHIIVYNIPKSNSLEPFLLLGSGWHIFEIVHDVRTVMKNSEILIVNPTNSEMNVTLNLVLSSIKNEKIVTVYFNNEKLNETNVPFSPTTIIQIKNLVLKPGVNVVTLDTDEYMLTESKREISFVIEAISIIN